MKKSPNPNSNTPHPAPISEREGKKWFVLVGVVLYLILFFVTPFEPYAGLGNGEFRRGTFLTYLLLPDEYFSTWLGSSGVVSLFDRIPIFITLLLCLMAATGAGNAMLSLPFFNEWKTATTRFEFRLFSCAIGLSVYSTFFLGSGLLGVANSSSVAWTATLLGVLGFLASEIIEFNRARNVREGSDAQPLLTLLGIPATILLLLGGMIPSTDYDVLSYHLAAARDFATSGRIGFQEHNVYANMPFGAEMFAVWGIALFRNGFYGAMVGKTLISATALLTGFGLYCFGKRFFTERTGILAAILYIGTPWIIYVSTAGLIDGVVGMYAFFGIYALFLTRGAPEPAVRGLSGMMLVGFLAGSAAACKYPAMLFVVLPLGVAALLGKSAGTCGSRAKAGMIFFAGVIVACGGWYIKNYCFTGNPVYPLCFSVFGDSTGTWTPEVDARWNRIHSPHDFSAATFFADVIRVALTSPWIAPLTIPFAVSLFVTRRHGDDKRLLYVLLGWTFFVWVCWWFLTHRIDRFWIPVLPVLTLLAAIGIDRCFGKSPPMFLYGLIGLNVVFTFIVGGAAAPGKLNHYVAPLESIRRDPAVTSPWSVWFNAHPPESGRKILLVGEAKAFPYDVPVEYSTCFNAVSLEHLRERNIAFVLVDWSEIGRFRSPGNYGFPSNIQPDVFDKLVADGVLERYCPTEELAQSGTVVYSVR